MIFKSSILFKCFIILPFVTAFNNSTYAFDGQSSIKSNWTVEYTSHNVSISTKPYSENTSLLKNKTESEFLEVKSTVAINAPIETVLQYFKGQEGCWEWQLKCKKSTILEKKSDAEQIVYTVINMPWPLTDRDFVFDAHVKDSAFENQPKLERTVTIMLTPFSKPQQYNKDNTKYVRAESHIQYQLLESSKKTTLNIYMHTEFGGSISPSLINARLVETLRADIEALLHLIDKNTGPST